MRIITCLVLSAALAMSSVAFAPSTDQQITLTSGDLQRLLGPTFSGLSITTTGSCGTISFKTAAGRAITAEFTIGSLTLNCPEPSPSLTCNLGNFTTTGEPSLRYGNGRVTCLFTMTPSGTDDRYVKTTWATGGGFVQSPPKITVTQLAVEVSFVLGASNGAITPIDWKVRVTGNWDFGGITGDTGTYAESLDGTLSRALQAGFAGALSYQLQSAVNSNVRGYLNTVSGTRTGRVTSVANLANTTTFTFAPTSAQAGKSGGPTTIGYNPGNAAWCGLWTTSDKGTKGSVSCSISFSGTGMSVSIVEAGSDGKSTVFKREFSGLKPSYSGSGSGYGAAYVPPKSGRSIMTAAPAGVKVAAVPAKKIGGGYAYVPPKSGRSIMTAAPAGVKVAAVPAKKIGGGHAYVPPKSGRSIMTAAPAGATVAAVPAKKIGGGYAYVPPKSGRSIMTAAPAGVKVAAVQPLRNTRRNPKGVVLSGLPTGTADAVKGWVGTQLEGGSRLGVLRPSDEIQLELFGTTDAPGSYWIHYTRFAKDGSIATSVWLTPSRSRISGQGVKLNSLSAMSRAVHNIGTGGTCGDSNTWLTNGAWSIRVNRAEKITSSGVGMHKGWAVTVEFKNNTKTAMTFGGSGWSLQPALFDSQGTRLFADQVTWQQMCVTECPANGSFTQNVSFYYPLGTSENQMSAPSQLYFGIRGWSSAMYKTPDPSFCVHFTEKN